MPVAGVWIGIVSLVAGGLMWAAGFAWAWVFPAGFIVVSLVAPFKPGWGLFGPVISHGPRSIHKVSLTFDDGPDPVTTPKLLDLLDKTGTSACFFVTGENAERNPDLIHEILEHGHEIGNHSDSHDPFLMLRGSRVLAREIDLCQQTLEGLGVRPLCFRPPIGIMNPKLWPLLESRGLKCVVFSLRGADMGNRRVRNLATKILSKAGPGDVVLLHDRTPAPPNTVDEWLDEVAKVVKGLRQQGLEPVSMSELLSVDVMKRVGPRIKD